MDPNIYYRLWDRTLEAYDPNVLRTRRHKHPITERWLADDARSRDPAFNQLHFLPGLKSADSVAKLFLRQGTQILRPVDATIE
jgi:hypothetical protein